MEALGILKFWRNSSAGDEVHGAAFVTEEEETEEDDSFFDLVFKSPSSCGGNEASNKDFEFIESPRDVFLSKNEFMIPKPLSPAVTLVRSTPKFKVFMLGFKRTTKCEKVDQYCGQSKANPANQSSKPSRIERGNRISVKCGMEETPIASVLGRENSLRSRLLRDNDDDETNFSGGDSSVKSITKYLRLIRPFQMKASKKAKVANSITPSHSPVIAPVNLSPSKSSVGSRSVGSFKIVARNLAKSRSASATASSMPLAPPSACRRDDSLLEQHDGIQGAILHCKKSYNSSSKGRSSSSGNTENAYEEMTSYFRELQLY